MSETIWTNVVLYSGHRLIEGGRMIVTEQGTIRAVGDELLPIPAHARVRDGGGALLLPGFIDVHVHGGNGYGVMDAAAESLDGMSVFHARHGTTAFLATTSTSSNEHLVRVLRSAAERIGKTPGAELAGIHLEGPYLDEKRRGAQSKEHLRLPSQTEIEQFLEAAGGHMRLVTLAPELEGALAAVSLLAARGITVSAGHSDATYRQIEAAIQAGLTHTTHHFNGMSPLHHREPGLAGAGLALGELTTELICDGIHVHPAVVKLLFDTKAPEKVCLITDAVSPAGLPDGEYGDVVVRAGEITLKIGSSLAGSSLTMLQALKNAMRYTGYPLEKLLPSLTIVPARQAKLDRVKGSLQPGKHADFVLLTPELRLLSTFVRGKEVYSADQAE
ncbi:N-acetylglucosamine-6-phosphate deacetylase [Paenibacillus ginsengarvi]|uniref:N-acetylglucosamine-6-phosphate deacetylase n=1 Tax=Paenibacillus ginsengarvi TaxID=400777 RepID=A0A3B0CGJ9_9BACL|nr:N-acetylglucosamine-6-phosphate deacetylase [Paenibacillus ginsengarvi]RKN84955.1 N-acetylglucosamine-6-phosphate deacetylase [Paenibacillus ginsengarvi]